MKIKGDFRFRKISLFCFNKKHRPFFGRVGLIVIYFSCSLVER